MEVKFTWETMEHLDSIKRELVRNSKDYGFETNPGLVTDKFALEYAIAFTAELMNFRVLQEQGVEDPPA